MIVVDASMVAAWLLPDEKTEATDAVLDALDGTAGIAPSILRHEVRSILLLSERRKRLPVGDAEVLLGRFSQIAIDDRGPGNDAEVLLLARAHRLTPYDAAYLALAQATGLPLATLDRALGAAARTCGVPLLGPLAP
ncbi:type II toxin-antitoxin system VapC family toxin [Lichenibacterium dinghuense]|uniref:type II toxin-antitoxin system VapC family toxin n=1 Tax=Lichenibacterium dinghuense TaxID=2895977 RepID=UPI001F17DD2B|nr:type II toxin-antitoxin system VapC family toxin [Lichenibacterium sp. 6Y81]